MAREIYTLEFDADSFTSKIEEAIAKIEELQGAAEDAAGAAEDLAGSNEELTDALASLEDVLKEDAKGVDNLNKKQQVLTKTQDGLNKNSAAYKNIAAANVQTQKQLAEETAKTTKNSEGFGKSVLTGARNLNSMKRAVGLVTGAFRLLGAFNPLGLILTAGTAAIAMFASFSSSANKSKEALEKLNDPNTGLQERINILEDEISKLDALEARRGSLSEEEQKQRDELTQKYRETADEIVKIETERLNRITDLQNESARLRVKLLGNTVKGITESFKVESDILGQEALLKQNQLFTEINKLAGEAERLREAGDFKGAANLQKSIDLIEKEQDLITERLKLQRESLKVQRDEALSNLAKEAAQKAKEAAQKQADFNKMLLEDERDLRLRIEQELADDALGIQDFLLKANQSNNENAKEKLFATQKEFLNKEQELFDLQRQQQAAKDALDIEKRRNQELAAATNSIQDQQKLNEELTKIDEKYNEERKVLDRKTQIDIAKERIRVLKELAFNANILGIDNEELKKQVADAELQLEELLRPVPLKIDVDTQEASDKIKAFIEEVAPLIQQVTDAIFNFLSQQASALVDRLDDAVNKSKSALDEIRNNSQDFNADQLAFEKKRLQDLENERKKAAEREANIARIQIIANTAVAVAKAAAQGGIAAPFTIASTLIALIAGFASAKNAASGAFFTGTEYLERNGAPIGRDTIHIRAHEGERIVPTANNMKYFDAYSALQNEKIPASIANTFAHAYQKGGLGGAIEALKTASPNINLRQKLGENAMFFLQGGSIDINSLRSDLKALKDEIHLLPYKMPTTSFHIDEKGLYTRHKKLAGKDAIRRGRAK